MYTHAHVRACRCQREEEPAFTPAERKTLDYLYGEQRSLTLTYP